MAKRSRNIEQKVDDHYPKPQTAAESAWESMKTLLDHEMPGKMNPGKNPLITPFRVFIAVLLGGMIAVAIILFTTDQNLRPENRTTPQQELKSADSGRTVCKMEMDTSPEKSITRRHLQEKNRDSISGESQSKDVTAGRSSRKASNVEHATVGDVSTKRLPGSLKRNHRETVPTAPPGHQEPLRETTPGSITLSDENRHLSSQYHAAQEKRIEIPEKSDYIAFRIEPPAIKIPVPQFPENLIPPSGKEITEKPKHSINWGIYWAGNIPVRRGNTYLEDLKIGQGAYLMAIPGLWIGKSLSDKNELVLKMRPFFDYFAGNNVFYQFRSADSLAGSPNYRMEEARLRKTTGSSISLHYQLQVTNKLRIGAGASYLHHWRAAGSIRGGPVWGGGWGADSLQLFSRSDPYWEHIRPDNITVNLDISYQIREVGLGGSIILPAFPPGRSPLSTSRPLNGQLYIRWRLK